MVERNFFAVETMMVLPEAGNPARIIYRLGNNGSTSVSVHTRRSSVDAIIDMAVHSRNDRGERTPSVVSKKPSIQSLTRQGLSKNRASKVRERVFLAEFSSGL